MGSSKGSHMVAVIMVVVAAAAAFHGACGQEVPDCVSKLLPCLNYLNSTAPPETCCSPLRETFQKEVPCLCDLLHSSAMFQNLGINITQVLQLPKFCGINYDINVCGQGPAAAPVANEISAPSPGPDVVQTPGITGSSTMVEISMPVLLGVLSFAAYIMA